VCKRAKEVNTLKTMGLEAERNFSLGSYMDKNNQYRKCYNLNGNGMRMMLNAESTIVRFKTEEYIDNLENKLKQQPKLPSYSEALTSSIFNVVMN